jgi:ABC-2 type transport system permease protein
VSLLYSELIKVAATRRTVSVMLVALLGVVALATAGTVDSGLDGAVDHETILDDVLTGVAGSAVIFALVLGVLVTTWEYQHGTMTHTLLAAPRRERVLAAKAVTGTAVGVGLAVVAAGVALAIALPWLGSVGSRDELGGDLARLLVGGALWGCLGIVVGAVVASQVGAVVGTLVWLLVVESVVGALTDEGKYLPGRAMQSFVGVDDGGLDTGAAFGVSLLYLLAFAFLGLASTLRRDVS